MAKKVQVTPTIGKAGEKQEVILLYKILEELKKLTKTLSSN